jgi:hypothetical protein
MEKRRPFYITSSLNSNYKFGTGSIPEIPRNFQKRNLQINQKIGLTFPSFWAYRIMIYLQIEAKLGFIN